MYAKNAHMHSVFNEPIYKKYTKTNTLIFTKNDTLSDIIFTY